ncbi:MAG: hypothetical protein WBB18_13460, partial [Nodosilinea sp.]
LIQDLNQCNDALLLRVTELEEDLERSQVALQAEIERNHQPHSGALPADAIPGPVQQQIAQLLSELDVASDGLRRSTIHNETLQAELDVGHQRVAQLERECTLLQQRFSEKNTALHQAEETCRDLKARLHRQQRYTLQFKAALEKCLNMSSGSSTTSPAAQSQIGVSVIEDAGPVTMPRSQQIQPWSAGSESLADNPSLTYLLRGMRETGPSSVPAPASQHDLPQATALQLEFTAPPDFLISDSMPEEHKPVPQRDSAPAPGPSVTAADPWLEVGSASAESPGFAAPPPETAASEAMPALFTEPSPWGNPVTTAQPPPAVAPAELQPRSQLLTPPAAASIPSAPAPTAAAMNLSAALPAHVSTSAKAQPSPLVYPLRSQKKIKSIAAVELPSFGRAVRRL